MKRYACVVLFIYLFYFVSASAEGDNPSPLLPTFESAAVPNTTGLPSKISKDNQYDWDLFAWETFIALNWPAIKPIKGNGYQRGFPNLDDESFIKAGEYQGPLVWETFKEKREVFLHGVHEQKGADPGQWNSNYQYGADRTTPSGSDLKRFYSSAKFTTLDETVEVRAEALEKAYENEGFAKQAVLNRVFRGQPVKASASNPGSAVRYEVKVNYDFWKYIKDNQLYFDPNTQERVTQRPPVQLPWRTSLNNPGVSFLTQKPAELPYVESYSSQQTMSEYMAAQAPKPVAPHPPRVGAIHLKAAWAPISESEKSKFISREAEYFYEESGQLKTSTSLFGLIGLHIIQRIKVNVSNKLLNNNALGGTFIYSTWEHRDIKDYDIKPHFKPADDGYEDPTQYYYTNYFQDTETNLMVARPNPFPSAGSASLFPVYRLYPILPHTHRFNDAIRTKLLAEGSVWANYRLVGTQFSAVNISTDGPITSQADHFPIPTSSKAPRPSYKMNPNSYDGPEKNIGKYAGKAGLRRALATDEVGGQPAYLANLVIETNLGLQQFQGLPPNQRPVPQFASAGSSQDPYKPNLSQTNFARTDSTNVAYGGKPMNTGGCMGCHGVAQGRGYSFSFVLLGGQAGADPDTELDFAIPFTSRDLLKEGEFVSLAPKSRLPTDNQSIGEGATGRAILKNGFPVLSLEAKTPRPKGSPFQYGDDSSNNGVYLKGLFGKYLTASNTAVPGQKDLNTVVFTHQKSDAALWYFYDAENPGSTDDVLDTDFLSFKNASIKFSGDPAFLTFSEGGISQDVNVTSFLTAGAESLQVFTSITNPLYAGYTIALQNSRSQGLFLDSASSSPVKVDSSISDFTLVALDGRATGSPLYFGDGILIQDSKGRYLTVNDDNSVSFQSIKNTPGTAWYLYDAFNAESNRQVRRLAGLSFKSADRHIGNKPAFLSVYSGSGAKKNDVIVVDKVSDTMISNALWDLIQQQP